MRDTQYMSHEPRYTTHSNNAPHMQSHSHSTQYITHDILSHRSHSYSSHSPALHTHSHLTHTLKQLQPHLRRRQAFLNASTCNERQICQNMNTANKSKLDHSTAQRLRQLTQRCDTRKCNGKDYENELQVRPVLLISLLDCALLRLYTS